MVKIIRTPDARSHKNKCNCKGKQPKQAKQEKKRKTKKNSQLHTDEGGSVSFCYSFSFRKFIAFTIGIICAIVLLFEPDLWSEVILAIFVEAISRA